MSTLLQNEFNYYLENQADLVQKYMNKFIVIKDQKVIGDYKTELEAYEESIKNGLKLGTFLIQHCLPGSESYSNTFYSRVHF